MEDLTSRATHLWRLLKWGRTLARHGALRGIERDPLTPPQVRRLVRIARFGARIPPTPDYAAALQAIGPAAIKLGQALSTRPDLVGPVAVENLSRLQALDELSQRLHGLSEVLERVGLHASGEWAMSIAPVLNGLGLSDMAMRLRAEELGERAEAGELDFF